MPSPSPLDRIEELKAQIVKLQDDAVQELRTKRERLAQELADVDEQLAQLTGKPLPSQRRPRGVPATSVKLEELTAVLKKHPGQTLNIRKEGYETAAIRALVAANPSVLRLGNPGPWPTVTLL